MLRIRNISTARSTPQRLAGRKRLFVKLMLTMVGMACFGFGGVDDAAAQGWSIVIPVPNVPRQRVSVTLSGRELRAGLENLASQQNVVIFLDRRVDPNQKIDVTIHNLPLYVAFEKIAEQAGLATSQLGPVTYFGPPETARKLRTLAERKRDEIRRLPSARRRDLQRKQPLAWNALTTPRRIVAQLSANYGLALTNPDTMPHDLWPAVILPPLDLADQLTLLAAGFDRTFEIDENGHTWQFVPIPEQVEVSLGRRAIDGLTCEETVKRMREAAPDAKITVQGKRINVTALIEDHERIMMAMVAARQASEKADMAKEVQGGANAAEAAELVRHRINLKVANARLGVLLNHVAKQLELRFEYDESIAERNISLDQRVTIDVSAATVDEFFTAVLQDTGLTFRRQGKVVQILVAP